MRGMRPLPVRLLETRLLGWRALAMLAIGVLQLTLGGCASWQAPKEIDDTTLRARAVTETIQDVRLSAALLSAEDSRQIFGADVNATDIQQRFRASLPVGVQGGRWSNAGRNLAVLLAR